jgi:hypothetical protein
MVIIYLILCTRQLQAGRIAHIPLSLPEVSVSDDASHAAACA